MKFAVASTFVRQVVIGLVQLVIAILIARYFGAEGNGIYNITLLLPLMLNTLLNLGIGSSNVYFIASKKVDCSTAVKFSLITGVWLSIIGLIIGLACLYFRDALFPNVSTSFLFIAILAFPFSLLQSYISSIFLALERFELYNLLSLFQPVSLLVFVASIIFVGLEQISCLLYAYLISYIMTFLLHYFFLTKLNIKSRSSYDDVEIKSKMIKYGLKSHLSNVLSFINYRADLFLVNFFISPIAAGIYVISIQITEKLWLISQSVSTVLLPKLSSIDNANEDKTILTVFICRLVFISTLICSVFLAVISFHFVKFIFGIEYIGASLPILILLPGVVFGAVSRVIANDIASRGRPELNLYGSVLTVTVNILGNILLIPLYGLEGAALATTIAYIVNFLTRYVNFKKITNFKTKDLFVINEDDISKIKKILIK